jgi:RNA polymerase sigma-70 factor (ECF subfamily)
MPSAARATSKAPLRAVTPIPDDAVRAPADDAILDGLLAGQEWAAEALYARLQPVVERTLRRVLRERTPELEDLVQSTFERIVRTLLEQRFARACSLPSWAAAIATHVGLDAIRARSRERKMFREPSPSSDGFEAVETTTLERKIEARRDLETVHRLLAKLNPEQARTLILHDVLGHELAEVAVLTGASVAAAQSRLVRGRKELLRLSRSMLKGER